MVLLKRPARGAEPARCATLVLGALWPSRAPRRSWLPSSRGRRAEGPLLPVLSFPLLIPLLVAVVGGNAECALPGGLGWAGAANALWTLGRVCRRGGYRLGPSFRRRSGTTDTQIRLPCIRCEGTNVGRQERLAFHVVVAAYYSYAPEFGITEIFYGRLSRTALGAHRSRQRSALPVDPPCCGGVADRRWLSRASPSASPASTTSWLTRRATSTSTSRCGLR